MKAVISEPYLFLGKKRRWRVKGGSGATKKYPKSMSQNEKDKSFRNGCLVIFFGLVAVALIIWGLIELFNWWFNRTIGSSDDWSGVWVFGLGVFAMLFIWNMFD